MNFTTMLKDIFSYEEFLEKPPVLLDIGSSGEIDAKWSAIAPYSICIAADADEREMLYSEKLHGDFKKLYIIHRIVAAEDKGATDFYLTRSPYCSSSLPPDTDSLRSWDFSPLFIVENVKSLPTVSVSSILAELNLDYIDWFKTDSQGTDLRLFASLPESCLKRVLAAEFEPGIINAYSGEDKLWQVLEYMDHTDFWMSGFTLCGQRRLPERVVEKTGVNAARLFQRKSPGWGELTYLNTVVTNQSLWTKREYMLAWVFACIERQFGFAAEVAAFAGTRHSDAIFGAMENFAHRSMTRRCTARELALHFVRRALRKVERVLGEEKGRIE